MRRTIAKITILGRKTIVKENKVLKEIQRNNTREKEVVQALEKQDRLTWKKDGVVYIEGRIYVLNNKKVKKEILKENHDSADVGHLEQHKMLDVMILNP